MEYENVGVNKKRHNGLKFRVMQVRHRTSIIKYVDNLLEKDGIQEMTEQELNQKVKKLEAVV
jgi:hypothetical protein